MPEDGMNFDLLRHMRPGRVPRFATKDNQLEELQDPRLDLSRPRPRPEWVPWSQLLQDAVIEQTPALLPVLYEALGQLFFRGTPLTLRELAMYSKMEMFQTTRTMFEMELLAKDSDMHKLETEKLAMLIMLHEDRYQTAADPLVMGLPLRWMLIDRVEEGDTAQIVRYLGSESFTGLPDETLESLAVYQADRDFAADYLADLLKELWCREDDDALLITTHSRSSRLTPKESDTDREFFERMGTKYEVPSMWMRPIARGILTRAAYHETRVYDPGLWAAGDPYNVVSADVVRPKQIVMETGKSGATAFALDTLEPKKPVNDEEDDMFDPDELLWGGPLGQA